MSDITARALANKASSEPIRGDDGKVYRVVAGAIRTPTAANPSWHILNDDGHAPMGISGVTGLANGLIRLSYNFTAKKVVSLIVTPHRSLVQQGYMATGASVGLTASDIQMTRNIRVSGRVMYSGAWLVNNQGDSFMNISVSDMTNGVVRITHDNVFPMDVVPTLSPMGAGYMPIIKAWNTSFFDLTWYSTKTGEQITTPDANCIAMFSRQAIIRPLQSDPIIENGTLWVKGIFEV